MDNPAENSNSELRDSLREVLLELREQKEELNLLRNDVRNSNVSVRSEVQKLKAKELSWKHEGHKIQFNFNSELEEALEQTIWAIQNRKEEYAIETIKESIDKIKKRNKLIRIADTSECGWDTVRQYESNPVASDSDDENRILKAESRALRKRKAKKQISKPKFARVSSLDGSSGSSVMPLSGREGNTGQGTSSSAGRMSSLFRGYGGPNFVRRATGACFGCGEFTHYRKDCPYARGPNEQSGQPCPKK